MKKTLFSFFIFFILLPVFSMDFPKQLYGIWEGKDRFVFFEESDNPEEPAVSILLKEYYGWYYDRALEPAENSDKEKRVRNIATSRKAESLTVKADLITKSVNPNSWELELKYSKFQSSKIAVTLSDDNIFLNFYIQDSDDKNYYRGNAVSEGIKVSQQKIPQNISCLYFNDEKYFDVRYWLTDMDFADEKVKLEYEDSFFVDKHVYSCGTNYSSVSGRSKNIRNVVQPFALDSADFIFSDDKSVIIVDKEPYLTKLVDKATFEDLMEIVIKGNSRRKPDPSPIFPPNNLDWHWDLIDALEANNEIIQAVRSRQKAFGLRGKDIGK